MYRLHFGLQERPFEFSDDPKYYFRLPHEIAWITLDYSLEQHQGMAMLTGKPGTGKTTLLRRLIEELSPNTHGFLLSDAGAVGGSLTKQFAAQLGIHATQEQLPTILGNFLEREASYGRSTVLMLDESQNLSRAQLDEVRFLSNRYASRQRWLQIFLVGQPSLEKRLTELDLESLSQRVAVRATVDPLTREQTASYVSFRSRVAGATNTHLFTRSAIDVVYENTEGVARLINILCERALAVGYAEDVAVIDRSTVVAALEDLPSGIFDPQAFVASAEPRPAVMGPAVVNDLRSDPTASSAHDVGARDVGNPALRHQMDRLERKLDSLIEMWSGFGPFPAPIDRAPSQRVSGGPRAARAASERSEAPLATEHDPFVSKL